MKATTGGAVNSKAPGPFPAEWAGRLKALLLRPAGPFFVAQLSTRSEGPYPEARSVQLRYLSSEDSVYVCTNMTFPKWKHVTQHPYVAISTFSREDRLALRLQADVELFKNDAPFTRDAWKELPAYQRKNYWTMASADVADGSADLRNVAPIFGCIKLNIQSWILDTTGEDDWIVKRQIYTLVDGEWQNTPPKEI